MRPTRLPLLLFALATSPLHAQGAAHANERRLPLNADGVVKVFNYGGAVRIVGWNKDTVSVTSTAPLPATFFMGGSAGGIKLGLESDGSGARADLTVSVPAGARVWVRTTSANVEVTGLTGALDVGTVEGRIHVRAQPQQLTVESMTGDIDVLASPAVLRIKGARGRVTWAGSSDDATVTTVEGAIAVRAGVVTRARFESVSGAITYQGGLVRGGQLVLDSHAGDVSAVMSRGAVADVEVDAPTCDLLGARTVRGIDDVRRAPVFGTLGKDAFPSARILLRSFKGRATVTQP
ncbi:MAG: hypothetical protein HY275_16345 [Gemmatimonadetes bacterium]|nr:hypothetical protein [Gemmatimonadota bacterium]